MFHNLYEKSFEAISYTYTYTRQQLCFIDIPCGYIILSMTNKGFLARAPYSALNTKYLNRNCFVLARMNVTKYLRYHFKLSFCV